MVNPLLNISRLPDLRKRLVFTLCMLAIYRLGVYIPTPGIDVQKITEALKEISLFGMMDLLSGGALENFSIFALGIMPYISASIIFQLLTVSIPSLKRLQEEGEAGRAKITQWTRYGTVMLTIVQGLGISYGLFSKGWVHPQVQKTEFLFTAVISLAAGTAFIMWLGEQISERGIGNGISLVIFSGIIARIPQGFMSAWEGRDKFYGLGVFGFLLLLGFIFLLIATVIFFERCQRRIPIHYAKRVVGNKMYAGQTSHLPLKINMAGVIPPIFASSILLFLPMVGNLGTSGGWLAKAVAFFSSGIVYYTLYVIAIIFFTFFYTAVTFNPVDVAENLQKHGGFVPGIRPGKSTSDYLDRILTRITTGGALYIAGICILPQLLSQVFGVDSALAATFGGTSILIVVGVAMDTVAQVESHLLSRSYEGFLGAKGGRFKGRRG